MRANEDIPIEDKLTSGSLNINAIMNFMEKTISVSKLHEDNSQEKKEDSYISDPQKALDLLERLRIESGKFLYEYPARFRRVIEVTRRIQDLADIEKLESS